LATFLIKKINLMIKEFIVMMKKNSQVNGVSKWMVLKFKIDAALKKVVIDRLNLRRL